MTPTGVTIPPSVPAFDIARLTADAIAKVVPAGHTRALGVIGDADSRSASLVLAFKTEDDSWRVVAGLNASPDHRVSGQVSLFHSW